MMRSTQRHLMVALVLAGLPFLTQCNCGAPAPVAPEVVADGGEAQSDGGLDPDAGDTDGGEVVQIQSLEISPPSLTLAQLTTRQLTATAVTAEGNVRDVTAQVTWTSSDAQVATVSNDTGSKGLLTAAAPGAVTITASSGNVTTVATVTVTDAQLVSVEVAPATGSIAVGTSLSFTATGVFSDQSTQDLTEQATWTSSEAAIATVSNDPGRRGLAIGVAPGMATLSAEVLGQSGTASLEITNATLTALTISPADPTIAAGLALAFTVSGTFTDGTMQDLTNRVSWSSSDPAVATISSDTGSEGEAHARTPGTTTIGAAMDGISASTTLTVTPATVQGLSITPPMPTLPIGATQALVATATLSDGTTQDVTAQAVWASSDAAVASVSNAPGNQGQVTAHAAGTATVSASFSGSTGSADVTVTSATLSSIAVTPANPSLAKGSSLAFSATATYSDGSTHDLTQSVTWASSNTSVATISNAAGSKGVAKAVEVGQSTITATLGTVSGSTELSVSPATVTALVLTPANASIAVGTKIQYTATATLSDGTSQDVTAFTNFSSSDTAVATISNAFTTKGEATGVSAGNTTVSGTWNNFTGSTALTVVNATLTSITVSPVNPKLPRNYFLQFTATGTYSNGSTQDLTDQATWSSSDTAIATISNAAGSRGEAFGRAVGTTTITATFNGINGSTPLQVTNATLTSIAVTPDPLTLSVQETAQLTATGTFSDGSQLDVTSEASWSSSKPNVAVVSNFNGAEGRVVGMSSGTTTITAAVGGVAGTAEVTVQ